MGLLLQYNLINLQVFNLNKFSNHKLDNIWFYSWQVVVVFDLGWQSSGVQTEPEAVTPRWLVLSPAALLRVRVSRVRVRDEPLGEDDESGQLRDITIRLGSTPSLRSLSDCTWPGHQQTNSTLLDSILFPCHSRLTTLYLLFTLARSLDATGQAHFIGPSICPKPARKSMSVIVLM